MLNYQKYFDSLIDSLLPPERMTVDQWADKYRKLKSDTSAFAGDWSTNRTPYMRYIMQMVTDPAVAQITLKLPSQVGKSELLLNIAGYFTHIDPCTMMFLFPTMSNAESFSKERFTSMVKSSPVLNNIIDIDKKTGDNTVSYKKFDGGYIVFVGSQTAKDLASRPIRVLLADEADRFALDADGEGCPLQLAKKRTTNFWNAKWIVASTPTNDSTSKIEREWEVSSKHRYHVPCVHCGFKQHLKWSQVWYDKKNPKNCGYACESCGVIWDDRDRYKSIDNGEWIADNPEVKHNLGFHAPRFVSGFCTLDKVVQEWIEAQGDTQKLKVFVNTVLAETWKDSINSMDKKDLMKRQEDYPSNGLPKGVLILTAGVDVQADRLECMIVGWGEDLEAWVIDYVVLHGNPNEIDVWLKMYDLIGSSYYSSQFKRDLFIHSVAVDSGNNSSVVYNACYIFNDMFDNLSKEETKRYADIIKRINFYATKGASERNAGNSAKPIVDYMQITKANELRAKLKPFTVGTYEAKNMLVSMIKNNEVGGQYWHFSKDLDEGFFDQITSEELRVKFVNGRDNFGWHKKTESARNEAFDTAVLNLWCILAINKNMRQVKDGFIAEMNNEVKNKKEKVKLTFGMA